MLQHEETYGFFPSDGWSWKWVGDPDRGTGKEQPGGWLYSLLPYIEQISLRELGSDGDPNNWTPEQLAGAAQCISTPLTVATCPSRRSPVAIPASTMWFGGSFHPSGADAVTMHAHGDYAVCGGDQYNAMNVNGPGDLQHAAIMTANDTWPTFPDATGVGYTRSEVKMSSISDGTSHTYMLGEKYVNVDAYADGNEDGWDNETMYNASDDNIRTTYYDPASSATHMPVHDIPGVMRRECFGSAHSGGLNMLFCDGSVQMISYTIDPETHRRMGNRMDGMPVNY
jgi:prepilin-type processing-associated H-X9-DG protein